MDELTSSGPQYWASKKAEEAVRECVNYKTRYYSYLNDKGFMYLWNAVYQAYYVSVENGPFAGLRGEQANLMEAKINDFRNLIQHKVGIVINQNPSWEPMATNPDVKSLAQCKLAKSLLNYYQDTKRLRTKATNWVTNASLFGEGFLYQTWDATAGARKFSLPDDEGNPTNFNEGDVDQRVFEPVDIIRDTQIMDTEQNHWFIIRQVKNRWDTAAKYPELYNEITTYPFRRELNEYYIDYTDHQETRDLIITYTLVHKRTAALPEGRVLQYIAEGIVLNDGPLATQDFPLHRLVDTDIKGKNFGYTDAYDMLGVQDLTNGLWSTIITNFNAFGVQNILMPLGANISESSIGGNLNVIEWDPQAGPPPQALQLTAQPQNIFDAVSALTNKLETISGVNSTARGNPPPGVGSGVALSMMQSLNVQYNQGLQSSYVTGMEQVGTSLINLIKDYAHLPRVATIVGEANASYLREYKGTDLMNVSRVVAKLANPMTQTIQGRFAIGEMLAQKGLIKDASQLMTVLETGNLDTFTDDRNMQLYFSKAIVEAIRNGEQVPPPAITDDHLLHIHALASLASDIDIRLNRPEILQVINQQILAHMKFLQDPSVSTLMIALGQQPLPPPPAAPQPGPGPSGPGGSMTINSPVNNVTPPTSLNTNAAGQAATSTATGQPGMVNAPQGGVPTGQLPQNFAANIAQPGE